MPTREPDDFDAFYKAARDRLLVQTFALTGDLVASRKAVRDAFTVAWHRWRKLSRLDGLEEIEAAVRPHAWQLAQRRHTARVWHRERSIDAEVRETLDALGRLTVTQRKALLLTQLAAVSMPQLAREIGLPLDVAERELQTAASQFSIARDVTPALIRPLLEPVATTAVADVRWPRATIVRRAGNARRRTHTAVGVVGAVAALVVTGTLVTDSAGARPTLDRGTERAAEAARRAAAAAPPPVLPVESMLDVAAVDSQLGDRGWSITRTGDNDAGSGLVVPCQQERYADPDGAAALVRTFAAADPRGGKETTTTQITEASRSDRAAVRTFRTTVTWFAGCQDARVQLLTTRTPERVGDEAVLVVLRSWSAPLSTYIVGVGRTGLFTTTTFTEVRSGTAPDRSATANLLSRAVDTLCVLPGASLCGAPQPELTDRAPIPVDKPAALLSAVDLPPVSGVDSPWVGTTPTRVGDNLAATRCDRAAFRGTYDGATFSHNVTRTYLVPEADLPAEFGITETVGTLPRRQAAAFVDELGSRIASCPGSDLGVEVDQESRVVDGATSMTVWRLSIEVSDERTIRYWMAVLRAGTSVGQLTFVPSPGADMADGAFTSLAERALERLGELPAPESS